MIVAICFTADCHLNYYKICMIFLFYVYPFMPVFNMFCKEAMHQDMLHGAGRVS